MDSFHQLKLGLKMVKNQLLTNLREQDMMFIWEIIEETNIQGIIKH
jgi:hypothetical protein